MLQAQIAGTTYCLENIAGRILKPNSQRSGTSPSRNGLMQRDFEEFTGIVGGIKNLWLAICPSLVCFAGEPKGINLLRQCGFRLQTGKKRIPLAALLFANATPPEAILSQ